MADAVCLAIGRLLASLVSDCVNVCLRCVTSFYRDYGALIVAVVLRHAIHFYSVVLAEATMIEGNAVITGHSPDVILV